MRLGQVAQLAFILVASVTVYSFVQAAQKDHLVTSCSAMCHLRPTYAAQNRTVVDFELPNLQGKPVKLSSYLEQGPVVLNFWTKSCKPCLEEMPALAQLATILARRGVSVVTVSTDEGPEAVRDTLAVILGGKEPPFEVLFDPEAEIVEGKFGTTLYPETWLIDDRGIIRARFDGKRDWSGAFALEVLEMTERASGCPVSFAQGRPTGKFAYLCNEDAR